MRMHVIWVFSKIGALFDIQKVFSHFARNYLTFAKIHCWFYFLEKSLTYVKRGWGASRFLLREKLPHLTPILSPVDVYVNACTVRLYCVETTSRSPLDVFRGNPIIRTYSGPARAYVDNGGSRRTWCLCFPCRVAAGVCDSYERTKEQSIVSLKARSTATAGSSCARPYEGTPVVFVRVSVCIRQMWRVFRDWEGGDVTNAVKNLRDRLGTIRIGSI